MTANLARSNRIPSDWGLEVGTLAEVFRNTSIKRVCQVDLCCLYEHKHQDLSLDDPTKGLMKMATDILTTIFRTLASRGVVMQQATSSRLRSAYLRSAQDAIRQYHADALINGLQVRSPLRRTGGRRVRRTRHDRWRHVSVGSVRWRGNSELDPRADRLPRLPAAATAGGAKSTRKASDAAADFAGILVNAAKPRSSPHWYGREPLPVSREVGAGVELPPATQRTGNSTT